MGLPPRLVLPSLPTVRLPFDRLAAGAGRIRLPRLADRITWARRSVITLLRREPTPPATPGLGPLNLERSLDLAQPRLHRLSRAAALGPISRVDRKVLAILSVLLVGGIYGLLFANPAAVQPQAPTAVAAAAKPAPAPAATPAPAAPVDPFAQSEVNDHLRALRKAVGPGDQVRNLTLLSDGTMGVTIVNNGLAESVMVRGSDLAIEPLIGEPEASAALSLTDVRGGAITRMLAKADSVFRLPTAQLASLRLTEHPSKPGTFQWTGVWNDPARTTLYADQAGEAVSTSRPR